MNTPIRGGLAALLALGAGVGMAGPAYADTPDQERTVIHSSLMWGDCGSVTGGGMIVAEATTYLHWTIFQQDGEFVRWVRQGSMDAVLHGPRGDVLFNKVWHGTLDAGNIVEGEVRDMYLIPDRPTLVQAGRYVVDLNTSAAELTPGLGDPHRPPAGEVCEAIG
ncbi:hypothetical protein GA0070624_2286 [Micromonospora rhizosphaerae]|uniref:Uncharacterized protein n=1 Tax=Micromonospora rhizosphaerae TaxID=568872 RepID=A0A1C6RVW1_9ACTN|nr:hypothetical protein [Micromonospora rhizosphaerae]SCL21315.1 hypothetical protein GA0070624_2286 [Micromonospora rhizosphaerae]